MDTKVIFDTIMRDIAIHATCSELILSEALKPDELLSFMIELTGYTDTQLAIAWLKSRELRGEFLVKRWGRN